jgi:hypothetical protein
MPLHKQAVHCFQAEIIVAASIFLGSIGRREVPSLRDV